MTINATRLYLRYDYVRPRYYFGKNYYVDHTWLDLFCFDRIMADNYVWETIYVILREIFNISTKYWYYKEMNSNLLSRIYFPLLSKRTIDLMLWIFKLWEIMLHRLKARKLILTLMMSQNQKMRCEYNVWLSFTRFAAVGDWNKYIRNVDIFIPLLWA